MSPAKGAMRLRRVTICNDTLQELVFLSFYSPIHPNLPRQQTYFTKPGLTSGVKPPSIYFPRRPLNVVPSQVQFNQIIK